jgi:hypothetical protein
VSKTTEYKIERHRSFDLSSASEHIWYTLHENKKTLFGKYKWQPVKAYYLDFGGGSYSPVSGNEKWAKAIAKELKIGVPTK